MSSIHSDRRKGRGRSGTAGGRGRRRLLVEHIIVILILGVMQMRTRELLGSDVNSHQ